MLGDGKKVLFWRDRWINGYMVEEIAPHHTACQQKGCLSRLHLDIAIPLIVENLEGW